MTGSTDVFFGGLPPIASFAEVEKAIHAVGDDVLRFQFRQECGYGVIRFSNAEAATKACQLLNQVNGHPVGAHLLGANTAEWDIEGARPPVQPAENGQASMNYLLHLLRKSSSRQEDVDAALTAAGSTQTKVESTALPASPTVDALHISGDSAGGADQQGDHSQHPQADPNPLSSYPRCKHLIEVYRALPGAQNKSPLAVLHEYATRLSLELTYSERAESNLGPFTVEAKLLSVDRATLYSSGTGKGRGKKEAKQAAAAAVLETLLANVPLEDFLHRPTKQQQKRAQATVRSATGARDSLQAQMGARQDGLLGSPQPQQPGDSFTAMPQAVPTPGLLGSPPGAYSFHSQASLTFPEVGGPDGTSPTWFGNVHRPPDGLFYDAPYAYPGAHVAPQPQGPLLQVPPGYQLAAANAAAMYKRSHDAMTEPPQGHTNGAG